MAGFSKEQGHTGQRWADVRCAEGSAREGSSLVNDHRRPPFAEIAEFFARSFCDITKETRCLSSTHDTALANTAVTPHRSSVPINPLEVFKAEIDKIRTGVRVEVEMAILREKARFLLRG